MCSQAALMSKMGLKIAHFFLGCPYFLEHATFKLLLLKMVDGREGGRGGGVATWCSTVQFIPNSKWAPNPCGQVAMTTVNCCCCYHGCHCCRQSPDAGSQFLLAQRVNGGQNRSPPHTAGSGSAFTQVPWGVADSGPNSGTSAALSLSGTGVVEGVGAEEVLLVMLVVVVRSRYQYGQWKRHGHLHNKAINGVLNSSHTINI